MQLELGVGIGTSERPVLRPIENTAIRIWSDFPLQLEFEAFELFVENQERIFPGNVYRSILNHPALRRRTLLVAAPPFQTIPVEQRSPCFL